MNQQVREGACLCGAFRFEVSGELGDVRLCHCDLCRRANGGAFSANTRVPRERFRILAGADTVTEYESSPGAWKAFCATCGSPAYSRVEADAEHIRLRLGTLPRDVEVNIVAHVWTASKAGWDRIADGLPEFPEGTG